MNEIIINYNNFSTKVLIGQQIHEKFGSIVKKNLDVSINCTVVIITDNVVFDLIGKAVEKSFLNVGFKVLFFKLNVGEKFKNLKSFERACNFLAKNRIKRTDLIVSLGGGVVSDLAGFVSACFLRGIRLIQIPTTFLAMVDACVGGKAAVNLKSGKNLVGCFKQPSLVFCNLNFVSTLPKLEYFSAMAEVVKYAALFSGNFFNFLLYCSQNLSNSELEFIVYNCLNFKKKLVEIDEFDLKQERVKLNFGHTIGHAIERCCGYGSFTHGQAISIGMSFCTRRSEELGLTEKGEFDRLKFVLEKFNLPTSFEFDFKKIFKFCLNDKKVCDEGVNLVLIKKIGSGFVKKFSFDHFKNFLNV